MTMTAIIRRTAALSKRATLAIATVVLTLAGCGSHERASQMTSFSRRQPNSHAQLFTIPPDQMSHVQVVTVQPTKLTQDAAAHRSRAYNAFKTTPVITQVGGPVSGFW